MLQNRRRDNTLVDLFTLLHWFHNPNMPFEPPCHNNLYWSILMIPEGSEAPVTPGGYFGILFTVSLYLICHLNLIVLAKQSILVHNNNTRGFRGPPEAPNR